MPTNIRLARAAAIIRIQRKLERDSFPRFQMALIVSLTGAFGFLCSFLLLRGGVESMALRYPLALLAAYLFFLFLLWLWLRTKASDYLDVLNYVDLSPDRGQGGLHTAYSPGGGQFGGAGASGSFDAPVSSASSIDSSPGIGDVAGSAFDADELVIPLIAIFLAIALAFASLYVVYMAPSLFAEVLFDGVLSYTLYRHLRAGDAAHWLSTAFRRTVLPFGLTALVLAGVGSALAAYAPGAHSLGEAIQRVSSSK
jgi:hypothetical protein